MPDILICVDYNCTEPIKVIADNDQNLYLHKAHHTINLRYIQELITHQEHPIQLFLNQEKSEDHDKMLDKTAELLIKQVTQNILSLLAELKDKLLKANQYAQQIKSTFNYIQQNNLEKLLENQDIVISVFSDEHSTQDKLMVYEQNLATILNTFKNKQQQIENVFQQRVYSPMKIVIGAPAVELNFDSPLSKSNQKTLIQKTSNFMTNKILFKNEQMDENIVILQLQNLLYVDIIEIDLGGLFEQKIFHKTNDLFNQICKYQMLDSLTLCLMYRSQLYPIRHSNLSDLGQFSVGLSKLTSMRHLNLNLSQTKIKNITQLATAVGSMQDLVKLQLNFQDSPVQDAEEFEKSLRTLNKLEEFTINLCGTLVPQQLRCFFGSVSGFQTNLTKVYGKKI